MATYFYWRWQFAFLAIALLLFSTSISHALPAAFEVSESASAPALTLPAQPAAGNLEIEISIQGATNLGGFEFDVVYDHALAQITGISLRDFLGKTTGCNPGVERCAADLGPLDRSDRTSVGAYSYGAGAGPHGNGVLAVLHVQLTGQSDAPSLTIANPVAVDIAGNPIQGATLVLSAAGQKVYLPVIQR